MNRDLNDATERVITAAQSLAATLDASGHPSAADAIRQEVANLRTEQTPLQPTRQDKRTAARIVAWLSWVTVAPLLALAAVLVLVLTGCGGPSSAPAGGPDYEGCRAAAREAFDGLVRDTPTLTPDEAQALVDDGCTGLPATERQAIVDTERAAAAARYMDGQTEQ